MRYFVIGNDGQKYGPADIATLNDWVAQGRVLPTQILEEESSGSRVAAQSVPGLNFPVAAPQANTPPAGQPYGNYYARPGGAPMYGDGGQKDLNQAWIFAVLSLFCCAPIFAWLAFSAVKRAESAGNQNAKGPRILATVGLVLWVVLLVVRVIGFATLGARGH